MKQFSCFLILSILSINCNQNTISDRKAQKEIARIIKEATTDIMLLEKSSKSYSSKLKNALAKLKKAQKIDERNKYTFLNMAIVYSKLGEYRKASFSLDKILKYNDPYPELYMFYGFIYKKVGENKNANNSFKKALLLYEEKIKDNIGDVNSQINRLFAIYLLEGKEEAIKELDKLIKENPNIQQYQTCRPVIENFQGGNEILD